MNALMLLKTEIKLAFRILKRTLTPEAIQEYQKERAKARRIIKQTKKRYWQGYCSSIGKETELGEVWGC